MKLLAIMGAIITGLFAVGLWLDNLFPGNTPQETHEEDEENDPIAY